MLVKNRNLFDNTEVNKIIGKFQGKLQESAKLIASYEEQMLKLETDLDEAIGKDIIEETKESALALENLSAKKANIQSALEIEVKKCTKIKEILQIELGKLIPEASKRMEEDKEFYMNTVEKEAYKKLCALRVQQEEILLTLLASHDEVTTEMFEFNQLCTFAELPRYKKSDGDDIFQLNLFAHHRRFPEYGSAFLDCQNLKGLETAMGYMYNEANAYLSEDKKVKIKTKKDMDTAKFHKSIK